MRLWVRSLVFLSGLRIRHCRELWCRLQPGLGSWVAVAVADAVPIRHLAWEPLYAASAALEKKERKEGRKEERSNINSVYLSMTHHQNMSCHLLLPHTKNPVIFFLLNVKEKNFKVFHTFSNLGPELYNQSNTRTWPQFTHTPCPPPT